jgi:hypothetical protein
MAARAPAAPESNVNPEPEALPTKEQIRKRAHAIYIENARQPGRDLANWLQAEKELRQALAEGLDI